MRVTVPQEKVGRLVRWSRAVLFTAGAGMLGYCGWVLADTWIFQTQASREFDRMHLSPGPPSGPGVEAMGGLVGRMVIPRLGGLDDRRRRNRRSHSTARRRSY
jgi:hypothetical protein